MTFDIPLHFNVPRKVWISIHSKGKNRLWLSKSINFHISVHIMGKPALNVIYFETYTYCMLSHITYCSEVYFSFVLIRYLVIYRIVKVADIKRNFSYYIHNNIITMKYSIKNKTPNNLHLRQSWFLQALWKPILNNMRCKKSRFFLYS